MTTQQAFGKMRLELAFALSDVLHHLHFFGFVAFGGGGKIFKLDGGALGEVLSDLFSTGHERYGVKRWTVNLSVNLLNKSLAQKESRFPTIFEVVPRRFV